MEVFGMSEKAILERFIQKNPLAVMTRCIAGALLGKELDQVFDQNRCRQYDDTIKFSTIAMSMAEIALGTLKNRNQAYLKYQEELQTSLEAYYGKLNRTEPSVSEAVVRYSAGRAGELLGKLGFESWQALAGYRCFSLDGNHLQKTEKRLKETRGLCAAPLPGTVVARFDHQSGLFDQAYLLEDAHAQESSVLDRALADLAERDLVIADRHFCIVQFLLRLAERGGCFVIRQHGRLQGKLLGKRQFCGRIASGVVYEQNLEIGNGVGALVVRRITVELEEPTRDGDREIHVLSNVPAADASAGELADLYRQRWEIENAFYVLTMTLNCEMKSNCHPRCALFLFCMALLAYNCRQVLLAALYAEHEAEDVEQMSQYQVAMDVVSPMQGMLTAIDQPEWAALTPQHPGGVATFLRRISRHVNVRAYRKSVRGPKRPPIQRQRCKAGTHVATHRLLQNRKQ
jgi:DDE family transposase